MYTATQSDISRILTTQHEYFAQGHTLGIKQRREHLQMLLQALHKYEQPLTDALWQDLHKSYEEAYLTEFSIVYRELRNHIRNLHHWVRPIHKPSPISIMPARSKIITEPLGTALIIAPWNYPVQLLINPLIGAIAAGCTVVLKPSPYVPHVSHVLAEMIRQTFPEQYIAIVEGHRDVNQLLLAERWDIIFFTGSPVLGKQVMTAAAKHLTPVILELGGKSPCIVDREADLAIAARRIAWGKAINAGQTCIAPDYLMVHKDVKDVFLALLAKEFQHLLGDDSRQAKHYVRIVSDKAFERLVRYLDDGHVAYGGRYDVTERYIEPTILTDVSADAPVMQEEIFGPIFPVLEFSSITEATSFITEREKPLALYYFGKQSQYVLKHTSAGGTCINDTIMHIVNDRLPFGGVGNSGMGRYHGKESLLAFSHQRAVVETPTWIDMPFRYMPYQLFKWVKKLI